jgi:uncharacterized membrane protein YbjE (DUF340 family)
MNASHLTDHDIQLFIEGQLSEDNENVQHLTGCAQCQLQVSIYRAIYQASSEVPVTIDPTLEDSVMKMIVAPGKKKVFSITDPLVFVFMGICFLLLIILLGSSAGSIIREFVNMFAKGSHAPLMGLLFFAGILLIIFQVMDTRLMNNYYAKKKFI